MDALLILGGLLLIIVSVVWLVVLAFGTSLMWGVGGVDPADHAHLCRGSLEDCT